MKDLQHTNLLLAVCFANANFVKYIMIRWRTFRDTSPNLFAACRSSVGSRNVRPKNVHGPQAQHLESVTTKGGKDSIHFWKAHILSCSKLFVIHLRRVAVSSYYVIIRSKSRFLSPLLFSINQFISVPESLT